MTLPATLTITLRSPNPYYYEFALRLDHIYGFNCQDGAETLAAGWDWVIFYVDIFWMEGVMGRLAAGPGEFHLHHPPDRTDNPVFGVGYYG